MSAWEYLGIEPTDDEILVKRAYAKILKTIQPEIERDAFILLRNAYETAIADIRNFGLVYSDIDEDDLENYEQAEAGATDLNRVFRETNKTGRQATRHGYTSNYDASSFTEKNYHIAIELLQATQKLVDDEKERKIEKNWHNMLNHSDFKSLEVKDIYIYVLFKYFAYNNHMSSLTLPNNIWLKINNFCLWRFDELKLYKIYPEEVVDSVMRPIRVALKETTMFEKKYSRKNFVLSQQQKKTFEDSEAVPVSKVQKGESIEKKSEAWPDWVTYLIWMMALALLRKFF